MKKKTLLVTGILCLMLIGIAGAYKASSQSTPVFKTIKGPILIDRLQGKNFDMTLFYSDIVLSEIDAYNASHSSLTHLTTAYSSYTEGFIESDKNDQLLKAVNDYRDTNGLAPITYYTNYEEVNGYGFLSLSEGLSTLYIINLSTYEVTCPTFDSHYALEKQYVYHVVLGADAYYVLTAKANSYEAYWYALDLQDFRVLQTQKLAPPSKATKPSQYALDGEGNAYFIGNNSLLIITPEETINLPLNFNPETVFYANDQIYTLSVSELFLNYAIYDENFGLVRSGQVNLPNKFVKLVSYDVIDSTLYTITYDSTHPLYRNYITLYDLKNNDILYCQALRDPEKSSLALLAAHITSPNEDKAS